jgi:hypothetical protein
LIRVPRIIVYQLRFRGPAEKVWVEVGEGIWVVALLSQSSLQSLKNLGQKVKESCQRVRKALQMSEDRVKLAGLVI